MADRLVWADIVSAYALHEVDIHQDILEMWGHLRAAVIYFMRYYEGQHKEVHLNDAQTHLLQFACAVQRHFGGHALLTFQLHTCTVHLPEEVTDCRAAAFRAEWWVESGMQLFKCSVKYRAIGRPETTAVNHMLTRFALAEVELRFPTVARLLSAADGVRDMSAGKVYDSTDGAAWLSGATKPVSHSMDMVRSPMLHPRRNGPHCCHEDLQQYCCCGSLRWLS